MDELHDFLDRIVRTHRSMVMGMPETCIMMHMRTTINIDEALLREAERLSGLKGKTTILHAGLEALIARESARRLAALGGSQRRLKSVPRRRPRKAS